MNSKVLCVVLLTRDRKQYSIDSINSILNQVTNYPFNLIISDNSTNPDLTEFYKLNYKHLTVWSWGGELSHFEHFNLVLRKISTPYFMIFHDDDIMLQYCIEDMMNVLINNENASCIGCNSNIIYADDSINKNIKMFNDPDLIICFKDKYKFINRYLDIEMGGVCHFSSYIYRSSKLINLLVDENNARKYSDAIFLSDLLINGEIIWINNILNLIRYHSSNESHASSVVDYKKFYLHLKKNFLNINQNKLNQYRFSHLYIELESRKKLSFANYFILYLKILKLFISDLHFTKRVILKLIKIIFKKK